MSMPELADDPRFATDRARVEHRAALDPIVIRWLGERSSADVLALLGPAGVAASRVMTMDAIFRDPQYAARGNLVRVPDERLGEVTPRHRCRPPVILADWATLPQR